MPTYPIHTPDSVWEDWKQTVPSSYSRVEQRVHEHLARDLLNYEGELEPATEEWAERTLGVHDA